MEHSECWKAKFSCKEVSLTVKPSIISCIPKPVIDGFKKALKKGRARVPDADLSVNKLINQFQNMLLDNRLIRLLLKRKAWHLLDFKDSLEILPSVCLEMFPSVGDIFLICIFYWFVMFRLRQLNFKIHLSRLLATETFWIVFTHITQIFSSFKTYQIKIKTGMCLIKTLWVPLKPKRCLIISFISFLL